MLGCITPHGRCRAANRLSHHPDQAVQSIGKSMDWTLEDTMFNDLIFCATPTSRRSGHTPSVQTRAETLNTSAEAVEPDPHCQWRSQKCCSRGQSFDVRPIFPSVICEQLTFGLKHQWKSQQVCFGGDHGRFGLILAALLHAAVGSANPGGWVGVKAEPSPESFQ